jgi:hypothetical protein
MIAPGYYECTAQLSVNEYLPVPGATGVPVPMRPDPQVTTCGRRYQEMTGDAGMGQALSCECGMFAVATCSVCGKPLCGDDLRRLHGQVICETDLRQHQNSAVDRRLERAVTGYQRVMTAVVAWAAEANDPIERFAKITRDAPRASSFSFLDRERLDSQRSQELKLKYLYSLESQKEELLMKTAPMVEEARRVLFGERPPAYLDLRQPECPEWLISSDRLAEWIFARVPKSQMAPVRLSRLGGKQLAFEFPLRSQSFNYKCIFADGRIAAFEGGPSGVTKLSPVQMIGFPERLYEPEFDLIEPRPAEIIELFKAWRRRS